MLNHTYTSVKNANVVDCGKKEKIPSQPFPLLRDNYLGEYRTELDKKKVLANLGIATDLSLEWEYIKGDIGRSAALMGELDSRTKYISAIDNLSKTVIDGILYLESVVGGEQEGEEGQNARLDALEKDYKKLDGELSNLKTYLEETIEIDIDDLDKRLTSVEGIVKDITSLILVSSKAGNALQLLNSELVGEGEAPGLYVPDLSTEVSTATSNITTLQGTVDEILDNYVTKDDLGGDGSFDFVNNTDFLAHVSAVNGTLQTIQTDLNNTVKTNSEGHVTNLKVNLISNNTNKENVIKITDSFEMTEGIPLDVRFVRENLEELYKLPVEVCYPGMGVIVNSLSALYILRKPAEGVEFNLEYIKNHNNWKCPEDLVTVALTRQDYENLTEINPNVFYYIYEDEITRTREPKRDDYASEEEFLIEWLKWTDSLKVLSLEYMSASWGVDIENKLGKKANSRDVSILFSEINNIKGNGNNPSLESLNNSILELQTKDEQFKERVDDILSKHDDIESGRLVKVEKAIEQVKEELDNYVTKEYIQDSDNNFIFVKEQKYLEDLKLLEEQLSTKIETLEVVTDKFILAENNITISENHLQINSNTVANSTDVPIIEIIPQSVYDKKLPSDIKDNVFYYTYDGEVILVTNEDLNKATSRLQQQINVLFKGGTAEDIESTLSVIFLPIETWNSFQQEYQQLSTLVRDLETRLLKIEPLKVLTTGDIVLVLGDPERCYYEGDTAYITTDLITY